MKDLFTLFLAAMLILTAGCAGKPPASETAPNPPVPEASSGQSDPDVLLNRPDPEAAGSSSSPAASQEDPGQQGEAPSGAAEPDPQGSSDQGQILLSVDGTPLTVLWEENGSVAALAALLEEGAITLDTRAYGGFEQVGSLPQSLPRADVQMTTAAGDLVLYSGDSIVLFYGSNTWVYTKLGHIDGLSEAELQALLGGEQATVTLALS